MTIGFFASMSTWRGPRVQRPWGGGEAPRAGDSGPSAPAERVDLRLGAHLAEDPLQTRLGLGVDVRHDPRHGGMHLGDEAVHLVRDGAVAGVALAPGAQLDELHGLARVEVQDVADAVAQRERVEGLALAPLADQPLPLAARHVERVAIEVAAAGGLHLVG